MDSKVKKSLNYEDSEYVIDLFFKMLSELIKISMQISNEFIDSDTVHRRESKMFVSPESLKDYIFSNGVSDSEKKKRREYLSTEMSDLLARQIVILAGHRNSIEYGTKDLLKELDPEVVLKEELGKLVHIGPVSIPQRYIPFIVYRKAFKKIVSIFSSFNSENPEKDQNIKNKFFRPAFISGYLKSIHSDQEGPSIDSSFTENSN